jgi:hypothetical protein
MRMTTFLAAATLAAHATAPFAGGSVMSAGGGLVISPGGGITTSGGGTTTSGGGTATPPAPMPVAKPLTLQTLSTSQFGDVLANPAGAAQTAGRRLPEVARAFPGPQQRHRITINADGAIGELPPLYSSAPPAALRAVRRGTGKILLSAR